MEGERHFSFMHTLVGWFTTCVFCTCSKHSFKALEIPGRPGAGCSGALLMSGQMAQNIEAKELHLPHMGRASSGR